MHQLGLENPFGTPIYHIDETTSTMDEARRLTAAAINTAAGSGAEAPVPPAGAGLHGTVIVADYQRAGRGRAAGRTWHAAPGESLLCTLILQFPRLQEIPAALPLRLGVAVALTLEELWPQLAGRTRLKWPNDVLIDGKKVCGILCEGASPWVYAGMGINLLQKEFPPELSHRSISVLQARGGEQKVKDGIDRYRLLINLLQHSKDLLAERAFAGRDSADMTAKAGKSTDVDWHRELDRRLYKKGERVRFLAGSAEEPSEVRGILDGVSATGELLIRTEGERQSRAFITGELDVYNRP